MSASTNQATRRWVVDPERSTVEFRVPNLWGLASVAGQFTRFDGTYTIGPNERALELIVDADGLDTGNRRRDRHLRSRAFLDAEEHPHIRFAADDVEAAGDLRVRGELEVAGAKVPLSLEATLCELDGALEVEASTTVDQRDFGMTWSPLGMIRSPTTLHVKARLKPGTTEDSNQQPAREARDE